MKERKWQQIVKLGGGTHNDDISRVFYWLQGEAADRSASFGLGVCSTSLQKGRLTAGVGFLSLEEKSISRKKIGGSSRVE